ncbi:hypothetical protein O9993_19130 [Vibrio lentus]|nr:hypothetical protein [Vibrio lentus]
MVWVTSSAKSASPLVALISLWVRSLGLSGFRSACGLSKNAKTPRLGSINRNAANFMRTFGLAVFVAVVGINAGAPR